MFSFTAVSSHCCGSGPVACAFPGSWPVHFWAHGLPMSDPWSQEPVYALVPQPV